MFTKNIGLYKVIRPYMGLMLAHCQKVKEVGDLMIGELTIEAPVNGDCSYNGPKVVKFLVE